MAPLPNCAVPYEIKIRAVAIQARSFGDHASNLMLLNMLTFVAAGEYDQLRQAFDQLRPVYSDQLGPPPTRREVDVGPAPRPSRFGA